MSDDRPDSIEPLQFFASELRRSRTEIGRATVAVLGRTGAGKSSLVNGVFGLDVAATGAGAPVTGRLQEHRAPEVPITVIDSPGFELGADLDASAAEIAALVEERARLGTDEALHVVWYAVDVEQARIEAAEERLIARCAAVVPTVVVLTQSFGPEDDATRALQQHVVQLGLPIEAVVPVLARERTIAGHTISPFGLDWLIAATVSALPEGARRAFVISQRQAIDAKVTEARAIVARRALQAAGLSGTQQVSDDALARHQLRMLAELSSLFAADVPDVQLRVMVEVVSRGASGTREFARRTLALLGEAGLPYADVGGALVGGATAGAATKVLGEAYVRVATEMAKRELRGDRLGESQIVELFRIILRGGLDE